MGRQTKEKISIYNKKYRIDHPRDMTGYMKEYQKNNREKLKGYYRDHVATLNGRFQHWKSQAKIKAKKKPHITWELTLEDIKSFPLVCEETGVELTLEANHFNTISLDRIDSNLGYVKGNVRFVSWWINRMKGDLPLDVFRTLVKASYEYNKLYNYQNILDVRKD